MDYLSNDGLVGKNTKTEEFFLKIEKNYKSNKDVPSKYVEKLWKKYLGLPEKKNNSLNGNMFEAIVKTALYKEGIHPFFPQAKLQFVPNIDFDIIIFPKDKNGSVDVSAPICLSLKTSLRERYKQADLEGIALKNVYKRAKTYLVTMDKDDIKSVKCKISNKDIIGIDDVIDARSREFNGIIKKLKVYGVGNPPPIDVMVSKAKVY